MGEIGVVREREVGGRSRLVNSTSTHVLALVIPVDQSSTHSKAPINLLHSTIHKLPHHPHIKLNKVKSTLVRLEKKGYILWFTWKLKVKSFR